MSREYQQLLRGPRFRWWRPPLAILLALMFALLILLTLYVMFRMAGFGQAARASFEAGDLAPGAFVFLNLGLASLVPACMLATRIAHGMGAGYASSVVGRFRWRWAWRCTLITVPVYLACVLLGLLVEGPEGAIPAQQGLLLLAIFATTPLQAAGEEYFFRGLLLQNTGAWSRHPGVALVMSTVLTTALFTAAHGSADPWIGIDLALGSVAGCILIWRTGGLEAAIVLHAVNNVVGMATTVVFGGWAEGFVGPESQGEPLDPLVTLVVMGVLVPLLLRAAQRQGVERCYVAPPVESGGVVPPTAAA
jgi:uncharacterized protein